MHVVIQNIGNRAHNKALQSDGLLRRPPLSAGVMLHNKMRHVANT